ncbi:hypothetical protein ACFX1X_006409 [Malus domestica]
MLLHEFQQVCGMANGSSSWAIRLLEVAFGRTFGINPWLYLAELLASTRGLSTGGCIWPNFWHRLGVMNGTRLIYGCLNLETDLRLSSSLSLVLNIGHCLIADTKPNSLVRMPFTSPILPEPVRHP